MRISLLLEREPFGDILEKSLESFLPRLTGTPHRVEWLDRPAALVRRTANGSKHQIWVCNPYLNAIFMSSASEAVLDPVIKEFRRSAIRWRRPLQSAYVSMAVSATLSSLIGRQSLVINPEIPDGRNILIVGGNHKIRIIDRANGMAYGIRKHGFTDRFIRREVEARKAASKFNVKIPELLDVAKDFSWFKESYLSGTPINRLPENQAKESLEEAIRQLRPYYDATRSQTTVGTYATELREHFKTLIKTKEHCTTDYMKVLERLRSFIDPHANLSLETSASHGDFQPANILRNDSGTWLIDWEYSAQRQQGFDLLVYSARSRTPEGLAQRLRALFASSNNSSIGILKTLENPLWQRPEGRLVSIALFLLEDLLLRLEESSSSLLLRPDRTIGTLCKEATSWLSNQGTTL